MINRLTQFLYRTEARRRSFQRAHPDEPVCAIGAAKAIRVDSDRPVGRGARWVIAKRAVLLVTGERVLCGNWEIPVHSIRQAVIVRLIPTSGRGLVLKIATKGGQHYQFGLLHDAAWFEGLPFPVEVQAGTLRYSAFSIVLRLSVLAYLAWVAWRYFGSGCGG